MLIGVCTSYVEHSILILPEVCRNRGQRAKLLATVSCVPGQSCGEGAKRGSIDPGSESNGETDTTAKAVVVSTKVHHQLYGLTDSQGGGTKGLYPKNLQTKKL